MLEIETRETGGTSTARAVRRTGKIPGVLYGNGRDPFVFAVESRHLRETLAAAGGHDERVPGGFLWHDFRGGIGQRQNQRTRRHLHEHLGFEHAGT